MQSSAYAVRRFVAALPLMFFAINAGAAVPGGETVTNTVTVNYQDSSATTDYTETAQVDVVIVETFAAGFLNAANFGSVPDSNVDPGDDVTAITTAPVVWVVNSGNTPVQISASIAETADPLTDDVGEDFDYTLAGNGAAAVADGTTPLNEELGIAIVSVADASLDDGGSGFSEALTFYSATTELAVNDYVTIGGGTTVYEVHSFPTATTITLRDLGSTAGSPTFAGGVVVAQFDSIAQAIKIEPTGTIGAFADDTTPSGSTYTTTKTETDESVIATLTVTSTDGTATLPADLVYDALVKGPSITISKYVRNNNGTNPCTTNAYTSGTRVYCSTVTDAESGDQLEYLLVVKNANTAAVGDADLVIQTVVLTDVPPTTYTTFDVASEQGYVSPVATAGASCDIESPIWDVNNANADAAGDETWADDSARTNKGLVKESAGTATAYLGNGATNAAGGSLNPDESQCFSFTVDVL